MAAASSPPPPELTHRLILDYLCQTGRTKAVRCFQQDADFLRQKEDLVSEEMDQRGKIRRKILSGDIIGAVELLNDMDYQFLESNPDLYFRLKFQAFIEMVRNPGYELEKVLDFASEEFVPCPDHLLHDLEMCMALLAFEDPSNSPLKDILNGREKLASEVNNTLLKHTNNSDMELLAVLGSALWMDGYCRRERVDVCSDGSSKGDQPENQEAEAFFAKYV
jgi:hypothetical protein